MALTVGPDTVSRRHDAPPPAPAVPAAGKADSDGGEKFWGEGGLTFGDVLDLINPLQHLPVISSVYHVVTGDEIAPGARVFGGVPFGGVPGLVNAAINAVVEDTTGKDLGEHALALFGGEGDDGPGAAPVTVATAATPAGPGQDDAADGGDTPLADDAAPPAWLSAVPRPRHDPYATAALIAERGPTQHALDALGSALDKHGQAQAVNLAAVSRHAPEHPGLDTLL